MLFLFSINTCAFVLIFVFKLTKVSNHFLVIIAKRAFSNYKLTFGGSGGILIVGRISYYSKLVLQ